ncbi:phosphomannomutase [Halobacteriales archaeon QS_8_69_26]|nr:MAG: phosphomannomutase [Halobacteriales archaeon QS_8_69_26]
MTLFGTAGIRGPVRETVTPELALQVGRAAGRDGDAFVLARDGRETGPALVAAVEVGIESAGADVYRAGQLPTPALAFASRGRHGVMVTASHNPPQDNGIKVFEDGVEYDREGERRIENRVGGGDPPTTFDEWGKPGTVDVIGEYRDAVADYARRAATGAVAFGAGSVTESGEEGEGENPLDGLAVVVDCGNGMGSLATPQVLTSLGAEVDALNASVDGHFPARESKPTPESLADARRYVEEGEFDLGIGHDGDADRTVVIDGDGEVVHEDTVLAVLAEHYVDVADVADPVVVTTPNASGRIDERVEAAGGRVERVRLGALHEGVAAAEDGGGTVVFAGEPWKHVHTAFGGWIDGVTSAAVVSCLVADAGGIGPLRDPVTERPYRKVSVECPDALKGEVMDRLETALPDLFPEGDVDTEYGVRVDLPDGSWVLVRPSGTEPYVRVYAESDDVDELVEEASATVEAAVAAAGE